MNDSSSPFQSCSAQFLNGKTVRLFGPFLSMSVRETVKLIRSHGGEVLPIVEPEEETPADWIIIGEKSRVFTEDASSEVPEWFTEQLRENIECGRTHIATETQLLQRLFPSDDQSKDLTMLYTPAMLAELLHVTVSDVRHLYQRGLIVPVRIIQRLPYFNLEEVLSARRISLLLQNGVKFSSIEKKLRALRKLNPCILPMLAGNDLVIQGKNIFLRQNNQLLESTGQMVLDFEALEEEQTEEFECNISEQNPEHPENFTHFKSGISSKDLLLYDDFEENEEVKFSENTKQSKEENEIKHLHDERQTNSLWKKSGAILEQLKNREEERISIVQMRLEALALEEAGKLAEAEEMWRNVLLGAGANAEDAFQLGDLLLRENHLEAARERFSMAVEMDEDFVEARASLGCVLGELGEIQLAIAALQGALAYHPDYVEAYFHLARFLEMDGQKEKACVCYRKFLEFQEVQGSFWGKEAKKRLEELQEI